MYYFYLEALIINNMATSKFNRNSKSIQYKCYLALLHTSIISVTIVIYVISSIILVTLFDVVNDTYIYFIDPPRLKSQSSNSTVIEGHKFDLQCYGTSQPIFNVSWYKDSTLISNVATTYFDMSNIDRVATLAISSANLADDGLYKCVLTNTLGSVTSTAIKVNIQCKCKLV